jgi:hypothetical protein
VTVNVRDFGAIGDGRVHRVSEWLQSGRFFELRTLQLKYPFVDSLNWTIDEVAFVLAKQSLPARGGTIYFPAGHYVSGQYPWRIWRDHIRLQGDGCDQSILSTDANIADGLVVSPYRHAGWVEGASREFPFAATSGAAGEDGVQLRLPEWAQAFSPGELVFIRDGANRYDQDYGEFNEVAGADASGRLRFKYPLARDYTLALLNWAGEVAKDFAMPARGMSTIVAVRTGEGFFSPDVRGTVTIGDNIFCVDRIGVGTLSLANCGRANAPRGTVILAGTKIGKSRSVLKLTRTARDFHCENLQIIGHRKALNLSNTYDATFLNCRFVRDLRAGGFTGGLTIDGDGGRFARFEKCRIEALPAVGMQFARSFGNVTFSECQFLDTNVAFTEFNFECEVAHCTFEVTGDANLKNVIVAGISCGGLRFTDNQIRATHVTSIFDTVSDIHSQKHAGEGGVTIAGNVIQTDRPEHIFPQPQAKRFAIADNQVTIQ